MAERLTTLDASFLYLEDAGTPMHVAGVMVLDDTSGLLSTSQFERFAVPVLARIFDTFDGLIRIYHNATPCEHLLAYLPRLNFEVFHFSHRMDIRTVKAALAPKAVMGNLSPISVMAHGTPDQVEEAALTCIGRAANGGGLILSAGGSLPHNTPIENIDALVRATQP